MAVKAFCNACCEDIDANDECFCEACYKKHKQKEEVMAERIVKSKKMETKYELKMDKYTIGMDVDLQNRKFTLYNNRAKDRLDFVFCDSDPEVARNMGYLIMRAANIASNDIGEHIESTTGDGTTIERN